MSKGLYTGTLMVGIDQVLFRGKAPWTLPHKGPDHAQLRPASEFAPIAYPKPDGVLTFDRTSDSPVGVFPERRAHQRTHAIADVWDNFGFDPATGKAMIAAAGMTARKYRIDRNEVDEVAFVRHRQYFEAKASGFLDRVLVPLDVLGVQGRSMGRVDDDFGVRQVSLASLQAQRELDTCVTGGTQTHASDGMATLLVATEEKARELSPRPEIAIRFVAKAEGLGQRVRMLPMVGMWAPVHATASGKVWLASLPDERNGELVRAQGLPAVAPRTITSLRALKDELARVRRQRYAIADEELTEGGRAIAAPIMNGSGVVGTVAISGPVFRMPLRRLNALAPRVRAAADIRRVFVNAVDDPAHATAYLGGVMRRDGITIAISTDGRAPALAAWWLVVCACVSNHGPAPIGLLA